MVYALLKEEMAREGGIHALQLRTRTPQEEKNQLMREKEEGGEPIEDTTDEKSWYLWGYWKRFFVRLLAVRKLLLEPQQYGYDAMRFRLL
jgi:hypothetical protein